MDRMNHGIFTFHPLGWIRSYKHEESFTPVHRTTSNSSIGHSSNSSGLVHDDQRDVNERLLRMRFQEEAVASFRFQTIRQLGAGAFGTVSP